MSEKLIEVEGLSKSFRSVGGGEVCLFKEVNFSISIGESLAICGESGSGKTSLLFLLGGLDKPTAGKIFWNKRDIFAWSGRRLRKARLNFISYVFQAYHLLEELSVLENVLLPLRLKRIKITKSELTRAENLLSEVDLLDKSERLIHHLSGGERQRVAFARALITEPKVLLADEPTGSLDAASGQNLIDCMIQVCKEKKVAVALVTHNKAFAKQMDDILNL